VAPAPLQVSSSGVAAGLRPANAPGSSPWLVSVAPGRCGDVKALGWPGSTGLLQLQGFKRHWSTISGARASGEGTTQISQRLVISRLQLRSACETLSPPAGAWMVRSTASPQKKWGDNGAEAVAHATRRSCCGRVAAGSGATPFESLMLGNRCSASRLTNGAAVTALGPLDHPPPVGLVAKNPRLW